MTPDSIVSSWSLDWRRALPMRTPAEQSALLDETRRVVTELQAAARSNGNAGHALHRKSILESTDATFEVSSAVPVRLRLGPFTPGATWPAVLRLSSAFPVARSDEVPDQRGLGVRIGEGRNRLDLLATTGEAHHARDARAMLASLRAAAAASGGGVTGKIAALSIVVRELGLSDGLRMVRTIARAAQASVSLAAMTFFSRAPFQLGDFAVRYRFAAVASTEATVRGSGVEALSADLRDRLAGGPVGWSFDLQGYLDPHSTPMDDHRLPWRSPWLPVATLVLRGTTAPGAPLAFRATPDWPSGSANGAVLAPLGDLNMLRDAAYAASQKGRHAAR